jgi:hypothetical protein
MKSRVAGGQAGWNLNSVSAADRLAYMPICLAHVAGRAVLLAPTRRATQPYDRHIQDWITTCRSLDMIEQSG